MPAEAPAPPELLTPGTASAASSKAKASSRNLSADTSVESKRSRSLGERASSASSARPCHSSSGDAFAIATARSARTVRSEEAFADTDATRLPTKTRNEMSSLSDDCVPSTFPRRTDTLVDRERTATASEASAPARRAASTSEATISTRFRESIFWVMFWETSASLGLVVVHLWLPTRGCNAPCACNSC